ncbi:MAG: SpaA isopeptide-forming pilin-related protein [Thermomicrobiales bacterium]
MPNPPAGFDPAPAVSAVVTDGETTNVQLQVGGQAPPEETPAPDTGVLIINKIDVNGNALPGSCFQVGDGAPVCDNGEGDADGLDGTIRIEGVPAGDQAVNETTAPEGYLPAAGQIASISLVRKRWFRWSMSRSRTRLVHSGSSNGNRMAPDSAGPASH